MQGFNMGRYYAPSTTSPPRFNTSSNLRNTQKRTSSGAQIVRFEMPFHVWCASCPRETIIPQGVRFNAEKKAVGKYLSTTVWAFRMRHGVCGGEVEIRTDPRAGEYVVWEGGRRRDYGEGKDKGEEGEEEVIGDEERERRRNDAFAALEGKKKDEEVGRERNVRVRELYEARERDWKDPYEASRRVRRGFRRERKVRARQEVERGQIREKFGLGDEFEIVDEEEADRIRAGMVEFGMDAEGDLAARPLFDNGAVASGKEKGKEDKGLSRGEREAAKRKSRLQEQLRGNTRAAIDPFGIGDTNRTLKPALKIPKKSTATISKNDGRVAQHDEFSSGRKPSPAKVLPQGLVDYDSD